MQAIQGEREIYTLYDGMGLISGIRPSGKNIGSAGYIAPDK